MRHIKYFLQFIFAIISFIIFKILGARLASKISGKILDNADIKNVVNTKKSYGGTSFDNIKKMIKKI